MKICVLASGSKGNCTYLETKNTKILIDVGMSCAYIEKNLKEIGVSPDSIDHIFITHTHSDHINGLRIFVKKYNPTVCFTEKMHKDLDFSINKFVYLEKEKNINDLNIKIIKTSHDASDSNGYIFESNEKSLVYITDTGYINVKNHKHLKGKNAYIIESNHDVKMLMNGKYPYYLQQRILGDSGHLSNNACAEYLFKFIDEKTKYVLLAHLSEENNTPEKALSEIRETFSKKSKPLCNVLIAKPKERTELIKLW